MTKLVPASQLRTDLSVQKSPSLRKARGDFRGDTLLPLTYSVQSELAAAHGSHAAALAMRHRARMQSAPTDGSGHREERVIVISDLHPSSGTDPETGRFDALDDFSPTQQRQLTAWMTREWLSATRQRESSWVRDAVFDALSSLVPSMANRPSIDELRQLRDAPRNYELPLILLGDIVDLLQTPRVTPGFVFPDGLVSHGRAPKNTPANALVQLNIVHAGHRDFFRTFAMHLFLGHKIDFVPGNHDRALFHPLCWEGELEVEGRKLYGFKKLLAVELDALGATTSEIEDAMDRIQMLPFVIKDDTIFEHGDVNDLYNKVRRPYKELIDPTPIHEEMELAFGDHGVRDGFNDIERARPTLDAIDDGLVFASKAAQVPRFGAHLVLSFFRGATKDGYDVSPAEDQKLRESDIAKLIAQQPRLLAMANQMRPPEDQLTEKEFVSGLQSIDRVSARPFFSNFKRGAKFLQRALTVLLRGVAGDVDMRGKDAATLDRVEAMHRYLGFNNYVDGHTHHAKNDNFLTRDEKVVKHINSHTWTSKSGNWGDDGNPWGEDSRGVAVMERGVTAAGVRWSEVSLNRVIDEDGILVTGDLLEQFEPREASLRAQAREIYNNNRGRLAAKHPTEDALSVLPREAKALEDAHAPVRNEAPVANRRFDVDVKATDHVADQ